MESLPSNTSEHDQVQPNQRKNPNLSVLEHLIQNRESFSPPSMSSMNVVAKHKSWIICNDDNFDELRSKRKDPGLPGNVNNEEPVEGQIQQPLQQIEEMEQIVERQQIEQYELPKSAS